MKPIALVISCEHGGNEVPKEYQHLFAGYNDVLETHRGLDIGSLAIADHLSKAFNCDYLKSTVTRLLIDCNRNLTHPECFSEFTKTLSEQEKNELTNNYYLPYRQKIIETIQNHIEANKQVLHLSIHSFTPEYKGVTRNAAISLLYDSRRHGEKEVARIWQNLMIHHPPEYRIRMNYPFNGATDGITSTIRKLHSEHEYLGIEVEMNQALVKDNQSLNTLYATLSDSLKELLNIL